MCRFKSCLVQHPRLQTSHLNFFSLECRSLCSLKRMRMRNCLPHSSHSKELGPDFFLPLGGLPTTPSSGKWSLSICVCTLSLEAYPCKQMPHLNFFSPVCVLICTLRSVLRRNFLSQCSHSKFFEASPILYSLDSSLTTVIAAFVFVVSLHSDGSSDSFGFLASAAFVVFLLSLELEFSFVIIASIELAKVLLEVNVEVVGCSMLISSISRVSSKAAKVAASFSGDMLMFKGISAGIETIA
ncbi:hypothetical protein FF38_03431 [Lucilia cuprina]|uniref:Uncharacterized protein n=1 Tax=Lucilia cuprina TaxID=7375 RepID=A0A0L0C6H3_LUCCU|nr:hypothetical protein FF38_03431 [Lucilia cuprina]